MEELKRKPYRYDALKRINDRYTDEELINKINNDQISVYSKQALVFDGRCLEVLVNDKDYKVRHFVALKGYRLDILINDKSPLLEVHLLLEDMA